MSMVFNMVGGGGGSKPKKLLSSLTEGSLVSVLEDGKLTPFYVAKHNYEADLNGDGRTLLVRKNIHSMGVWNSSNKNILEGSTIDTWLNGDYFNMLSATAKGAIFLTKFNYTPGVNVSTAVTTTQKKVFLLSATEYGLSNQYANVEGEALPIANLLATGYLNGTATYQWTRTPMWSSPNIVCLSVSAGTLGSENASMQQGVRPCFTLPADMALNTEPYADGSWGLADEDVAVDTTTASTTAKAGVTYTNGIAGLDADTLHNIASAISANPNITNQTSAVYYDKGDVHRRILVGDTQNINLNGVNHAVNILGFNHDTLSSGYVYGQPTITGKAGLTFQMVNCHTTDPMNASSTNVGGWESSKMRTTYMPVYLGYFTSELKGVLKSVTKLASAGGQSSAVNVTEDKLFLLSEIEVHGSRTFSPTGEGEQYAYYKAGNSKAKKSNGSASDWWLRSPNSASSSTFCRVDTGGNAYTNNANVNLGVAFAYCI